MCASLVPCLGTNARIGAAQGRDTKTGAQGGEKAHHLLHTGYKKLDVFVGDAPFLAALRAGLAAQVGLSAAVAQSIVPKTTPSSAANCRIMPQTAAFVRQGQSPRGRGRDARQRRETERGSLSPSELERKRRAPSGLLAANLPRSVERPWGHPPRGCARTRDFHMGLPTPLSRHCPRTWGKPWGSRGEVVGMLFRGKVDKLESVFAGEA